MIGKLKFYFERIKGYAATVGTISSVAVAVGYYDLSWWVVVGLGVLLILLGYLDAKFILRNENAEAWETNPAYQKLLDEIRKKTHN